VTLVAAEEHEDQAYLQQIHKRNAACIIGIHEKLTFLTERGQKQMAETTEIDLDVRELIPRERHSTIFARFDALDPGETLRLINDHDPKPLYYHMMAERPETFAWEPEQQGPDVWVIRIRKTATAE
jgi:uncharacterized protein (DUF2249 family)